MRAAYAIVLIFCARFAVGAWFEPGRDGDIAWQLWLGAHILHDGSLPAHLGAEAFSAPGAAWVPQEWMLGVLLAATMPAHLFALVALLAVLCAAATLLLTAHSARRSGASVFITACCTLCTAFAMMESFGVRAQVLAWPLLAGVMYLLRHARGRTRWWIVALTALWGNLHASAMLAPVLAALWAVGTFFQERGWNARVREAALLAGSCAIAVCATPLGIRLPLYAVALFHSPVRASIQEWQPAVLSEPAFLYGLLPLLIAVLFAGIAPRRRWSEALIFAACAWLAFGALRNVAVAAIVIAPAVAAQVAARMSSPLRIDSLLRERGILAALYAFVLPCAVLVVWQLLHTPAFQRPTLPLRAVTAAAAIPGVHDLFCEDFAWCSLALAHPNLREFLDGRCDPFPARVWNDYRRVYAIAPGWQRVLDRDRVTMMLVRRGRALAQGLALHPREWRLIYSDGEFEIYGRRSS